MLLLGGVACSKTDTAASTTTTAGATSTTAKEKDTDTNSSKSSSAGGSALEKLASGEIDKDDTDVPWTGGAVAEEVGIDLSEDEMGCLIDEFIDNPDLADIGDNLSADEASMMMDAISNCIPKEKFVSLVTILMDNGSFTQAQLDCIEEQLLTLTADMADPDVRRRCSHAGVRQRSWPRARTPERAAS
ncbi:MAG: hypothetical protein R2699_15610 [Acidimicrobiales bacterium]